jgi:hypothetical protein
MNIDVAIVTAAGYPGDASKFEGRLQGLLEAFKRHRLPPTITHRCGVCFCVCVCREGGGCWTLQRQWLPPTVTHAATAPLNLSLLNTHGTHTRHTPTHTHTHTHTHTLTHTLTRTHTHMHTHTPRRFHLMGGECNYLLRVNPASYRLEFVPEGDWQTPEMLSWDEEDIKVCAGSRVRAGSCVWCVWCCVCACVRVYVGARGRGGGGGCPPTP